MIPNYQITGQQVTPEEIVDIIPEQEASDRQVQINEEKYFQQLKAQGEEKLRNDAKLWEGLSNLSSTLGKVIEQRHQKYREEREAEIKLDILTRGVSPELEAEWRGERDKLLDTDIATQEFASNYEAETGDYITATEFRKMAGWEQYMVQEQYAIEKAKGYDQYVYQAYENTSIDVFRDGKQVTLFHKDNLSPSEQAALDQKIKFEYAKQFAGLNDAMVAAVVKPEIDRFDEARRRKQAAEREKNYQADVAASDSRMISTGFAVANPEDGHQLAHNWAARYAARNRTTISAGRRAFADNLVSLVEQNVISYPEAISIVNHEITARDGSTKTMTSWKEWAGLDSELVAAAKLGNEAIETTRTNNIEADLQVIKSRDNWTNEQKIQMMAIYKNKYDGYVPTELSDALAGHMEDWQAEDMIEKSMRYQDGVYDFEMSNVSTDMFNKHKDKILSTGSMLPGTEQYETAAKYLKSYTDRGTGDTFGTTQTASVEWLNLYGNLEEVFNKAYKAELMQNGQIVSTPAEGIKAGRRAVEEVLNDPMTVTQMMDSNLTPSDNSYSKQIQLSMTQSAGGKWKSQPITADSKSKAELLAWYKTPLKQSKDIPDYYRDVALRMGINPIDLANAQVGQLMEGETPELTKEQKYNSTVLNYIYKFPTRSRVTRARVIHETKDLDQNVKTSIFNKKALVRQDQ